VDDIQEVVNYRKTLTLASEALAKGPIDLRLILQMHSVLMDSVRGSRKSPGQFRTEQNWIGSDTSTIETAKFVPPAPEVLDESLRAFESYVADDDIDTLIQCAVVHAQFEILHPFKDGNGRIGRLLIPLFLFQKNALASPMFYLSEYLESNRESYYVRLKAISDDGDWTGWIEFFLTAVEQQALENSERVKQIRDLYETMKQRIADLTRSQYALKVLDTLFDRPVFQPGNFIQRSGIPKESAAKFLRALRNEHILVTIRESSGPRSLRSANCSIVPKGGRFFSVS